MPRGCRGLPRIFSFDCGVPVHETELIRLAGSGILVEVAGVPGGYRLPDVLARAVRGLGDGVPTRQLTRVAAWFVASGRFAEALQCLRGLNRPGQITEFLSRHGPALIGSGHATAVVSAIEAIPERLRDAELHQLAGHACQVLGDWHGAWQHVKRLYT